MVNYICPLQTEITGKYNQFTVLIRRLILIPVY